MNPISLWRTWISRILFLCPLFISLPGTSHAFLGFSNTTLKLSYSCLGLDGVPISDSTLAASCCDGSNLKASAPDTCRTSMYGASVTEATTGVGTGVTVAQSALDAANDMKGATTSYVGASPTPTSGTSGVAGDASALTAGGSVASGNDSGGGGSASGGANGGAGATGNGSSSFGSSGGAGSASGPGVAGGTGANVTGSPGPISPGADGGAYVSANDAGGDSANGKGSASGAGSGGLFGALFGGSGAKGVGDAKDANFSDASGTGSSDPSNALAGEAISETTTDPADYFSRIDKSASIFKVVSDRYAKENERKHLGLAKLTQ